MSTQLAKELPLDLSNMVRRIRRNASLLKQSIETRQKPLKELYDQFESLGDVCEFAGLQRANGVERSALFNWRATSVPLLIKAIESKLDGVDKIENLRIELSANPRRRRQEYFLHNEVFGTQSHTFVHEAQSDAETVLKREHRNLILLKRKFLEDIYTARRIYVYRTCEHLEPDDIKVLSRTLRSFGDNCLLWVSLADERRQVGAIERIAPGLVHGRIDALALPENGMEARSARWPALLRNALRCFEESGDRALGDASE
jgi:hypothetical protein